MGDVESFDRDYRIYDYHVYDYHIFDKMFACMEINAYKAIWILY